MFQILKSNLNLCKNIYLTRQYGNSGKYIQGTPLAHGVKEFYFYIDPNGMLFLDDDTRKNYTSCIKDKKFLDYFIRRLVINTTDQHKGVFPYVSVFDKDRCYIRCDRLPIVFTQILNTKKGYRLSICRSGSLYTRPFEPRKLIYSKKSGNIYHPGNSMQGGIGVLSTQLVDELKTSFHFGDELANFPTHFHFNDRNYTLKSDWKKTAHLLMPL